MNKQTEEDITEILLAIYKVPGQYVIGAMILFALYDTTKELTNASIIFPIFAIIFIILEIISPIMAGKRLYKKAVKGIKKILK
jgi:hypothetical protein